MQAAITELEIKLDILRTNAPIHRSEGKTEQADKCVREIAEIEEALNTLKGASGVEVPMQFEFEAIEREALKNCLKMGSASDYKMLLEGIRLRRDLNL